MRRPQRIGSCGLLAILACALVLASLAPAGAAGVLTAQKARVGDHPAFVRVVVDFGGGAITENDVLATDVQPFDGLARLRFDRPGVRTEAPVVEAQGVRVRVTQGSGRLRVGLRAVPHRFKYVSYTVVGGTRLAIDLWKSAPPSQASTVRQGRAGCLTLDTATVSGGAVHAAGREQDLFEHGLLAVVRGRDGRALGRRPVTAPNGRWSARVPFQVAHAQAGTFEAVAASAKDGSLVCLVQARVTLPATS